MRVLVLTFGTRGDIQPYIGLCTALIAAGHQADICTHPTHKPFIEEFGVGLVPYPGPHPQQLFDYCVRVGIFGYNFMLEISQLAHSFMSSWGQVCKDNKGKYDIIVNTFTSINHGIVLAEASGVPACTIHYVPVGDTKYFYSPYAPSFLQKTASYSSYTNLLSHQLIEYLFGILATRPINKTRRELGLEPIYGFHAGAKWAAKAATPSIHCYSPAFLPKPVDFPEQSRTVGYFWLPEKPFTPPEDVAAFLEKGKPVYVGFGSVNVPGSKTLIPRLLEGIRMCGERAIVFTPTTVDKYKDDPDVLFVTCAVPHSYLFPKVKLAIHHGGAGTVAYALKAGIPSIIMPFFGDHFLWAQRLQEMGCGPHAMPLKSTQPQELAATLRSVLKDPKIAENCRALAEKVNAETAHADAIMLLEHLHKHGCFPRDESEPPREPLMPFKGLAGFGAAVVFTVFFLFQALLTFPLRLLCVIKTPPAQPKGAEISGQAVPGYPGTVERSALAALGPAVPQIRVVVTGQCRGIALSEVDVEPRGTRWWGRRLKGQAHDV
eukprot:CAMPEP_0174326412 /NCGR_PEP_ID=MMETSP0810-20121108/13888_1 /TAXON_ID=73025 ORGANISM="Eutreptiella gymnastica-like, Strain CCMP1594" /NCGR_SAMPLE_ID=MMETSP0810 /ASSEMBLY_ACC=CAM_ASM_000659 /LENGTH=545 /DNA_ID=CAMNT_0015440027 /DNA_START=18 /DNA_END=1654 /DNA_ORIENTATION=-